MNHWKISRASRMLLLAALAMMVVVAGCSNNGNNVSNGTPNPDNKVNGENEPKVDNVSLEFWAGPIMDEADFQNAIDKYTTEIAPHVDINLTYVPFNGIDEKVNIAIAANTFPDLYMDGSVRLGPLSVRGIAAPLDSYVTDDFNMDDILEGPQQLSRMDGKLMTLLAASNISVMMVNKSLFIEAGAEDLLPDPETRTWSREQFSQAVEKIGALGNGIYGMGLAAPAFSHDRYLDGYIYNDGDSYTNESYDKVTYNSEKNINNFDWLIELATSKNAVPGAAGNNDSTLLELFKQGKVAAMNYNAGYYELIQKGIEDGSIKAPIDIMFAHYPTTDGSVGKLWLSIYGLIVKEQEDENKKKEAANFALWLTSGKDDAVNQGLYVTKGQIPVRKSLQELIQYPEIKVLANMAEKPIGNIFNIPEYQQFRKLWGNQFQQALTFNKTAKEALDDFAKEAQQLLDQANQKK